MAYSGIGGQAVMEGVMMKYKNNYAVAVRKPDHEIIVETRTYHGICKNETLRNFIFIRGIINFIESMILGMSTLTFSASFFEEEQCEEEKPKNEKKEKAQMGITIALSVLRLLVFLGYILLISQMKDIRRVFMYHGAEHKCINCLEHGMDLTMENVKASSREHKRCGTSFLFFVVIISIIATMFIRVDARVLRLVLRIAIIPLVAAVSYEFIRLAGRSENPIICLLSKPGLWMQKLTTKEPDEEMIEVGIASVEAVFDWKEYLASMRVEKREAS